MEMQEFIDSMKERPPATDWKSWYDSLIMPHWTNYLSPYDVEQLRYIATSKKLAGNMPKKQEMIKAIMRSRGFARFAGGTNRLIFKCYEDPTILAKVAIDTVGMKDNPLEFRTQHYIKPFCAKMLQITPCGTVGFAERLMPITSSKEFQLYADEVFDFITLKLVGKYVVDDIGTQYFMNYAVRPNFGPCLIDYPYIYELDGQKLMCTNIINGFYCGGEIDYDSGFNHLTCTKCGKGYKATDLRKQEMENRFVISKGGHTPMVARIMKGGQVIATNNTSNFAMDPNNRQPQYVPSGEKVKAFIRHRGQIIESIDLSADQRDVKVETEITEKNIFPEEPAPVSENSETKIPDMTEEERLAMIQQQYARKDTVVDTTPEPVDEPEETEEHDVSDTETGSQVPEFSEGDFSQEERVKEEDIDQSKYQDAQLPPFKTSVVHRANTTERLKKEARDSSGRRVIGAQSRFIPEEDMKEY